jgi:hypothetical protein
VSIRYEHTQLLPVSPDRAFAVIDDLPLTAKWLPPCVSLEKIGAGPNATGDRLRYVYRQGRKQAEMEGEILDRRPGERLYCKYSDAMFDVLVDLRLAPAPGGTTTVHAIEMIPKSFGAKIMTPLVKLGIGKQTRDAAANLKRLVEAPVG